MRSKSRFAALDETAVFGSICRHEFPQRFLNLKHGERLANHNSGGLIKVSAVQVGLSSVPAGEVAAAERREETFDTL